MKSLRSRESQWCFHDHAANQSLNGMGDALLCIFLSAGELLQGDHWSPAVWGLEDPWRHRDDMLENSQVFLFGGGVEDCSPHTNEGLGFMWVTLTFTKANPREAFSEMKLMADRSENQDGFQGPQLPCPMLPRSPFLLPFDLWQCLSFSCSLKNLPLRSCQELFKVGGRVEEYLILPWERNKTSFPPASPSVPTLTLLRTLESSLPLSSREKEKCNTVCHT